MDKLHEEVAELEVESRRRRPGEGPRGAGRRAVRRAPTSPARWTSIPRTPCAPPTPSSSAASATSSNGWRSAAETPAKSDLAEMDAPVGRGQGAPSGRTLPRDAAPELLRRRAEFGPGAHALEPAERLGVEPRRGPDVRAVVFVVAPGDPAVAVEPGERLAVAGRSANGDLRALVDQAGERAAGARRSPRRSPPRRRSRRRAGARARADLARVLGAKRSILFQTSTRRASAVQVDAELAPAPAHVAGLGLALRAGDVAHVQDDVGLAAPPPGWRGRPRPVRAAGRR